MMKSLSNCSNSGFYRCFHDELTIQEFSTCPRKCFSISTFLNATPICKTKEEFQCAHDLARKLKKKTTCYPACTQVTFDIASKYQDEVGKPGAKHNMIIAYKFITTKIKVEEEYLIHDFVGMLGSIGGTLGLFIGFSFLSGISYILKYVQVFIKEFISKKSNKLDDVKKQKIIEVMPRGQDQMSDFDDLIIRIQKIEARVRMI